MAMAIQQWYNKAIFPIRLLFSTMQEVLSNIDSDYIRWFCNSNSFNFYCKATARFYHSAVMVFVKENKLLITFQMEIYICLCFGRYFGDNTYAFTPNATHLYATSGTYPFSMAVTDSFGCQNHIRHIDNLSHSRMLHLSRMVFVRMLQLIL